jgi:LuxR family maltose regulon positive regulatory protein
MVQFLVHNLACQVRLALHLGDTESAFRWVRGEMCDLPDSLPAHLYELQQISLAQVYIALGDSKKTIRVLDGIHPQAEAGRRWAHVIEICLLKALANQALGKANAAIDCLERSLSLAAPEKFCRTFIVHGEPMVPLLREAAARNILPAYTGKLLAAFGEAERRGVPPPCQPLVEPLSPRELQVLELLALGLSNREIGERLFLALDTVKGHNYRIYGKLGVKTRTQAVSKAVSLEILPPKSPRR